MHHAVSGDFSHHTMAFDSSENRALYDNIHAICLAIKEARKERKLTGGICSPNLEVQPLQKTTQHLHSIYTAEDSTRQAPIMNHNLQTTVSSPAQTPLALPALSSPGVAQHCLHPSTGSWSFPATPNRVGLKGYLCMIKNCSISILIILKGRGLPEQCKQCRIQQPQKLSQPDISYPHHDIQHPSVWQTGQVPRRLQPSPSSGKAISFHAGSQNHDFGKCRKPSDIIGPDQELAVTLSTSLMQQVLCKPGQKPEHSHSVCVCWFPCQYENTVTPAHKPGMQAMPSLPTGGDLETNKM